MIYNHYLIYNILTWTREMKENEIIDG